MELFAINLRKRAADLGISNAEVARRLDISERRYGHYIRGDREPDFATLLKISRILQTSPDHLLGFDQEPEQDERAKLRDKMLAAAARLDDLQLRIAVAQVEVAASFSKFQV
jgi:transcriptional regulator with XRE-family HTH domain